MKTFEGLIIDDRYRLVSLIAIGGMGQVWRGWDTTLDREVAVKILREEFTGDHGYLERFRAEARHTASLTHENIASLYDYGERDGTAFLVMELVPGVPLADMIEKNPMGMPCDQTVTILIQLAEALQVAHQEGVVHRDVKPENILVDSDDSVKITDFGIARSTNEAKITKTGLVMGTAQYLSPEQAMGKPATALSDIYSLGIVAFEMLSGSRPFVGESQVDIAMAQVKEPVPPLPPRVVPDLRDLVFKILSKAPMERPRSAASVVRALEAIQRGERPAITSENPVLRRTEAGATTGANTGQFVAPTSSALDSAPMAPPVRIASSANSEGSAQRLAPAASHAEPTAAESATMILNGRPATSAMPELGSSGYTTGTITGQRKRGLGLPSIALIVLVLMAALGGVLVMIDRVSADSKPAPKPSATSSVSEPTQAPIVQPNSTGPSTPASGTSSASPVAVPTPAGSSSPTPVETAMVFVDGPKYLGNDAQTVRDQLFALGLNVQTVSVGAIAGRPAGTVSELAPTGQLPQGSTITLKYTGESGIAEPPQTKQPEPSPSQTTTQASPPPASPPSSPAETSSAKNSSPSVSQSSSTVSPSGKTSTAPDPKKGA